MDFANRADLFRHFAPLISSLHAAQIAPDQIVERLTMYRNGPLQVSYAPFDYVAAKASLVVVGITPGRTQAVNAIRAAGDALVKGMTETEASRIAKLTGSFSGAMRSNLVALLDRVGVADRLGLRTCASLFDPAAERVHFTSALRYPVFINGENYNGSPDPLTTPILRQMIDTRLLEEAKQLHRAIWLPLGPQPSRMLQRLVGQGSLRREQVIEGLPHPSGANAERIAYFLGRKDRSALSAKTNAAILDAARERLGAQVAALNV